MRRRRAPIAAPRSGRYLLRASCDFDLMPGFVQLHPFENRPALDRTSEGASATAIAPEDLSDGDLISAIPDVTLAEALAVTAEAGKRHLIAAVPGTHRPLQSVRRLWRSRRGAGTGRGARFARHYRRSRGGTRRLQVDREKDPLKARHC